MEYKYGMKLRGFSIGCHPINGLIRREDDTKDKFHDILVYNRELEIENYELEVIR